MNNERMYLRMHLIAFAPTTYSELKKRGKTESKQWGTAIDMNKIRIPAFYI